MYSVSFPVSVASPLQTSLELGVGFRQSDPPYKKEWICPLPYDQSTAPLDSMSLILLTKRFVYGKVYFQGEVFHPTTKSRSLL